jgi:tetratricopeptide (TPR) repeat protein
MVILNFIKQTSFVIIILFAFSFCNAQSNDDMRKAFKDSYGYEAKADYYNAIDALKKVYSSNNYEVNLRLGWLYYLNQQYKESMDYYQTSINLAPNSIEAKFGYVYPATAMKEWLKVGEQYIAILNIDPQNSSANYQLGILYYYKPDYQTALGYFEKVVSMYPFDYSSVLMLGWTNFKLGKSSEAKTYFNKALLIKPDDPSALEGLGYIK